ncbi:MAG: riboflavin synthase [Proteobacteria bacterium]|jgi:riboflavin synthase|nr:riboflavin synthase [Pseudomonadota bacterium]
MFTGIVERTGRILSLTTPATAAGGAMGAISQLIIDAGKGFETRPGDSVAINGCCLTVTSNKVQLLAFDVSRETLAHTSLGELGENSEVNLERALKLGDRLGGHLVSGHIDGVGVVDRILKQPDGWELMLQIPTSLGRYVIRKGSICLDGVSLTVNALADHGQTTIIGLTLIPTTVSMTALKSLHEGQRINVEVDTIGKYVERLTQLADT